MTEPLFWANRIIESGAASPQELAKGMHPLNWRGHPEQQREALEEALDSLGILQPVLFNRQSGRVIDGHLRIELAVLKGQPLIPVNYVELTDDEEALALATLDAITEQAQPISEKLAALLERTRAMTADKPGLAAMLAELKARAGVNGKGEPKDAQPQIDKAAQLAETWGTRVGQVWSLGEHRLAVGDCTDRATVEAVMRGERAAFCFTDPPYGVKYTGGTKKWAMLENDDEVNMYAMSLPIICEFTEPKAALYLAFASANARSVYNALTDNKYIQRALIIWNKNQAQFGALGAQYHQKHEPIAYCFKMGQSPYWFGPSNEVTVWDINRAMANEYHPTQKPIELYERAINNSSPGECIVFEPFLGSGTSIIACQNLNRKCRAIELDPGYAGVCLQRFFDATGIEPNLT